MATSRAVVSCGVGAWFPRGQKRLRESLEPFGETLIQWVDEYPPESPTHEKSPYEFKAHAMLEASEHADLVLWADSSLWAVKPLDALWDHLEAIGYMFWRDGHALGQWTHDAALERFGWTRDEAMTISLPSGGIWGLDMRREQSQEFMRRYVELAAEGIVLPGEWTNVGNECSEDPRCKGHRHDMCLMSYLAYDMGMLDWINPPHFFAYSLPACLKHPMAVFLARGM